MSSIFISHSSHDNTWAERIRDWLKDEQKQRPQEQRFRSLFLNFDPDAGIQTGERWRDQLYEHLQLCAAVIVICSEAYAGSQWCLEEAEDPTPALAAVLRQAYRVLDLPSPDEDATTAETLHRQLRQLRLQSNQQDARVVIPIDQFEELLGRGNVRNPKAAAAADAFLALLAALPGWHGAHAGAIRNHWPSERHCAARGRCDARADPA